MLLMSKLDVNVTLIILRQNSFLRMMKMQIDLTSIPGHSCNVHSDMERDEIVNRQPKITLKQSL